MNTYYNTINILSILKWILILPKYNTIMKMKKVRGGKNMYCQNCGTQIPDGAAACPKCGIAPNAAYTAAQQQVQPADTKKKKIKGPDKKAKSYAAIFTALLVFPSTLCIAIDLSFDRTTWAGYVVGALLVLWVCAVLPVLNITPAPVTAILCFVSIVGYVFFVLHKVGKVSWLYQVVLPLVVLGAALLAAAIALISSKKLQGLHILSFLSAEAVVFLISLEAVFDNFKSGTIDLRWSLIISCAFVSIIAVFEAFSYIGRLNKK